MFASSRINEYFRMALSALISHKLRSLLTTLGILIGVTTIITIWTTIQGLNEYVYGELSNIGSASVYVDKYPWIIQNDFWKYRNRKNITVKEYEALKKHLTQSTHISPEVMTRKRVSYRDNKYDNIIVVGTTASYKETANSFPDVGRFLTESDVKNNRKVCVLGSNVADQLFEKVNPIGRRITVMGGKFLVVGIMEKKGSLFGQSMDDMVYLPLGAFRSVYGGRRGLRITVKTDDPAKLEDLKDEIRGVMRRVRKIAPADPDDFAINQQDMLTNAYKQLTGTLFAIVFVIGGISLLVGGIGIMNIMLVSVTERTKEIGIRKAIGAKRSNILSQFLIEAVLVSSIGGVIGIVLGYFAGSFVLSQMDLTTGVTVSSIAIGFGFSAFVGVSAGFYPALKASKLNPIESLRYES
jgi:putative ABC transport system permease protein